jgi:hypothetical protein
MTGAFVASTDMTCLVTSSVQVNASTAGIVTNEAFYFRNAKFVNGGLGVDDIEYGHYGISNGHTGYQPDITRSSLFSVSAGQSIVFGVFIGGLLNAWAGSSVNVATSYSCS